MEELVKFFGQYGLPVGLIALAGVILLGILKYCNAFTKFKEEDRHVLYLLCSVGFSAIGSAIYLAVTNTFDVKYFTTLLVAIYALNQAFYSIFKNTSFQDFMAKLLDRLINRLSTKKD